MDDDWELREPMLSVCSNAAAANDDDDDDFVHVWKLSDIVDK